jgi:hypothetical protein
MTPATASASQGASVRRRTRGDGDGNRRQTGDRWRTCRNVNIRNDEYDCARDKRVLQKGRTIARLPPWQRAILLSSQSPGFVGIARKAYNALSVVLWLAFGSIVAGAMAFTDFSSCGRAFYGSAEYLLRARGESGLFNGLQRIQIKKSFPVSHRVSNIPSRFHAFFLLAQGRSGEWIEV